VAQNLTDQWHAEGHASLPPTGVTDLKSNLVAGHTLIDIGQPTIGSVRDRRPTQTSPSTTPSCAWSAPASCIASARA